MKISTPMVTRSLAMAAMLATGAMFASAQTFVQNGIVYKVNKANVEVQKADAKLTDTSVPAPAAYTGDIKIPAKVNYNGKDYTVSKVGSVFKGTEITSFEMETGGAIKIDRGAFQGCAKLAKVVLPDDLTAISGNAFQDCVALTEITIPGTVGEIASATFTGCEALKKLVLADGEQPLAWQVASFGTSSPVEELVMNRQFADKYKDMSSLPMRNNGNIKKATIGGHCTELPASFFENAGNFSEIVFESEMTSIGTNCFAATAMTEFAFPEGPTTVSSSLFMGCKSLKKVTLPDAVTVIDALAFNNSALEEINFPESLKTIGVMAFSGSNLSGDIVLPETVATVNNQAFALTGIRSVDIPAATKTLGSGVFMGCEDLAKFVVAAENESFKCAADGSYITDAEGKTLLAYAPALEAAAFTGDFPAVADYAFYGAKNLKEINLPQCKSWGDYALYGTGIEKIAFEGSVGRYAAANCPALAELSLNTAEIPFGVAADCPELAKVNILRNVTVVKQDAFKNCAKVTELDLGNVLAILEADCFAGSGVKNLTVGAYYPAAMADGVFKEGDEITVTVPESLVAAYKEAAGWKFLTIKGDANLAVGGEDMGMPNGLYYAGDDGDLHCVYADGQDDVYPMGLSHTFQLLEFSHRIYGASAGKKFWYSASSATEGDGKLFYISKVGNDVFQAVVLDNTGNNAYKDPFGLYIYGSTLYVNDRNVCVRKISADAIALPIDYPSWMENNWMPFYDSNPWTWGCIKNGFAITNDQDADGNPEPLYWIGMKMNGEGLFSFKEKNIGAGTKGPAEGATAYLTALKPIATSFNIDEKNGDLYIYIEKAGLSEDKLIKAGLYRIKLDDLTQTPNPNYDQFFNDLDAQLIDGSPVKYEGSDIYEHVGISQLAIDANSEYMYWCYRAPTPEEAEAQESQDWETMLKGKYWWAEKYDETNPLHHSGIKRIKLGEENPKVEMVVEGVTGYGIVPVNFEGSTKPIDGVADAVLGAEGDNLVVNNNGAIVALEAAQVAVYNAAGVMVANVALEAGQAFDLDQLAGGLYVVEAKAGAAKQALKVVK
ncbi:MAG: leucine-rich repeat domain-containing protein [Muribaculaceae bacterium]|nr:leucine-rich repeat domain-containing protein [Muribaculaceae bacterium]